MCNAQKVFDGSIYRNERSWNSFSTGRTKCRNPQHALILSQKAKKDSLHPDGITFVSLLKACAQLKDVERGRQIHAVIARKGLLERDIFVSNALVDMYAKCGLLAKAQEVLNKLPVRDVVTWTALIAGFVKHECGKEALNCFEQMQLEGVPPNAVTFACSLKACGSIGAIDKGREIHAEIARKGLPERNLVVGNALVDMYAKCGSLAKAQEVFDKLPVRDVVSWTALIAGFAKHEHGEEALNCFEQMQLEGVSPNAVTFVCSLKACGTIGATDKGGEIHAVIAREGLLERDLLVGNALVDMYAKCGLLTKAHEVFDKLPVRDVISWTALIAGYAKHELGEEALHCFEQMQLEGVPPNALTFVCCLKACGSIGAIDRGQKIHAQVAVKGLLETNIVVGNALVDMYAKCGWLVKAHEVFDKLPIRNVVMWNALIAGYVQQECGEKALNCFEQMQLEGVFPNAVTFVCSLKACGSIGATDKGREIHVEIAQKGLLERDLVVGNALLDMYAKCGSLVRAQEVFDKLLVRDVVSWTTLISAYVKHQCSEEAMNCFEQMKLDGVCPNAVTFVWSLKACGSIGSTEKGREMHAEIARKGFLVSDLVVGNALVDMYAKCGLLAKAQEVFDNLPVRDLVSWNALIAGYAKHERGEEALNSLEQMQLDGISPNAVTLACSLKACGSIGATEKGRKIHAEIVGKELLERDFVVGNALVNMYAKCGFLAKAQEVFDRLPVRDIISWTTLIAGYAKHECCEEALNRFKQMQFEGVFPNAVTFICSLKACGCIGAPYKGMHAEIARKGFLEGDLIVGNALVDMYAKCGLLVKAQEVFDNLPIRDAVSWTALIAGYAKHEHGKEALNCFEQMQLEAVSPDAITFVCSLKACGSIGATDKGREIHAEIARKGLFERDLVVGNALVDMYAKCGSLAKAQEVFDKLPVRDIMSWNVLIAGYAQVGECENVFHIFDRMRRSGQNPDVVTFISVLNACSRAGLVDKGQLYFESMSKDYGISPTLEHHTFIVDLLGRAGHLDKAVTMIKKMPFHPDLVLWRTLLDSCRKWGNVKLGRKAFEHAMGLDGMDGSAYVCMRYIYIDADMQADADKIEAMRVKKQALKKLGHCGGVVHRLLVRDKYLCKLKQLSLEGNPPGLHSLSEDKCNDAKIDVLCEHSENLAIASCAIHDAQNPRVCNYCHSAKALVSKLEEQIIDAKCFHLLKEGECASWDYG